MSKFWTVLKREYLQVVKKKSFVVGIVLTPVLMAGFMLLPALLATKEVSNTERLAVIDRGGEGVGQQFTDALGRYIIEDSDSLPSFEVTSVINIPPADTARFTAVYDSLVTEVKNKELRYFLVIHPEPHVADSNLLLVTNSDNFQAINRFEARLSDILSARRLEISNINLPVDSVLTLTERLDLPMRDTKGESIPFLVKYLASLVFVMMIYGMILGYGSIVMRSVIEEKNSRIMEVLVSSVSPFQMMLGKILGLGGAAFTQVAIWVIVGAGLSGSAAAMIDAAVQRVVFNPVIAVFFVLFLVSGYIMYSTLFALIGSVVNSDKEAQSFVFPITMFLILPVILGSAVVRDPYVTWAQVLAYIPFFAPTMQMMRVLFIAPTADSYSLFSGIVGEATLSLLIVVVTTIVVVWLTSKIFRVGILMYGKRPTLGELVKWIKY
ncbi:MAG: ABC transporter permease [candidate division Zixibacteria bacterium]|nr:ABC transporter permease [candidate division Zixibacteria bacterium]